MEALEEDEGFFPAPYHRPDDHLELVDEETGEPYLQTRVRGYTVMCTHVICLLAFMHVCVLLVCVCIQQRRTVCAATCRVRCLQSLHGARCVC